MAGRLVLNYERADGLPRPLVDPIVDGRQGPPLPRCPGALALFCTVHKARPRMSVGFIPERIVGAHSGTDCAASPSEFGAGSVRLVLHLPVRPCIRQRRRHEALREHGARA